MRSIKFSFWSPVLMTLAVLGWCGDVNADAPSPMQIGSLAPDINVEHWLSDGEGKYEKTTKLKDGTVYMIEFWATWCGPCISEMPHIAQLQKDFAGRVQIISISDESLETVEKFLEQKVSEEGDKTYRDLTKGYCLTTDPDRSVMDDYFNAAKLTGIPTAFVVGGTGLVEWIGHPADVKQPLEQIVEGTWDRDRFSVQFKEQQAEQAAFIEAQLALADIGGQLQVLMQGDDHEKTLAMIDELASDETYKAAWDLLATYRLEAHLLAGTDQAPAELDKYVAKNADRANELSRLAWVVYEQFDADSERVSEALLKSGYNAAKLAAEAMPENGFILDTYAHLIEASSKDLDKAIEVQQKAVEVAGADIEEIQPYLDELLEKKKKMADQ